MNNILIICYLFNTIIYLCYFLFILFYSYEQNICKLYHFRGFFFCCSDYSEVIPDQKFWKYASTLEVKIESSLGTLKWFLSQFYNLFPGIGGSTVPLIKYNITKYVLEL